MMFPFILETTGVYHLNFIFYLNDKSTTFSLVNALQIQPHIYIHLERNKFR